MCLRHRVGPVGVMRAGAEGERAPCQQELEAEVAWVLAQVADLLPCGRGQVVPRLPPVVDGEDEAVRAPLAPRALSPGARVRRRLSRDEREVVRHVTGLSLARRRPRSRCSCRRRGRRRCLEVRLVPAGQDLGAEMQEVVLVLRLEQGHELLPLHDWRGGGLEGMWRERGRVDRARVSHRVEPLSHQVEHSENDES